MDKKSKKEKEGIITAFSRKSGLPIDTLTGYPYYQVFGNREIILEGVYKLSEYSEESVAINVGRQRLKINGKNLKLDCLAEGNAVIKGYITSIEYEKA